MDYDHLTKPGVRVYGMDGKRMAIKPYYEMKRDLVPDLPTPEKVLGEILSEQYERQAKYFEKRLQAILESDLKKLLVVGPRQNNTQVVRDSVVEAMIKIMASDPLTDTIDKAIDDNTKMVPMSNPKAEKPYVPSTENQTHDADSVPLRSLRFHL